jgi:hypothetical protein
MVQFPYTSTHVQLYDTLKVMGLGYVLLRGELDFGDLMLTTLIEPCDR